MTKVLFLIGSLEVGGAEKVLVDTANMMADNGYDVTVQTVIDRGALKSRLNEKVHYRTIVKSKNRYVKSLRLKLYAKFISPKYVYNRYVKRDYDYEAAFLEGMPTKIISASNNKKYAWVHINLMNSFGSISDFKNTDEYKKAYEKFDKVICVSEDVKNGFIERFGNIVPIEIKYNIVNTDAVIEKSKENFDDENSWNKDIFNFVSVGNLSERKAHDRLIRIAKKLKDNGYKFVVRIVGDGVNKGVLESLIDDLDVSDCVKLVGMKENPYPYIANSDVLICSSFEEGFSTVVTEAFILQTPVITTDCSGMREQFGEFDCGKIVPNDENDLYSAMEEYVNNSEIRNVYKDNAKKKSEVLTGASRKQSLLMLFE